MEAKRTFGGNKTRTDATRKRARAKETEADEHEHEERRSGRAAGWPSHHTDDDKAWVVVWLFCCSR